LQSRAPASASSAPCPHSLGPAMPATLPCLYSGQLCDAQRDVFTGVFRCLAETGRSCAEGCRRTRVPDKSQVLCCSGPCVAPSAEPAPTAHIPRSLALVPSATPAASVCGPGAAHLAANAKRSARACGRSRTHPSAPPAQRSPAAASAVATWDTDACRTRKPALDGDTRGSACKYQRYHRWHATRPNHNIGTAGTALPYLHSCAASCMETDEGYPVLGPRPTFFLASNSAAAGAAAAPPRLPPALPAAGARTSLSTGSLAPVPKRSARALALSAGAGALAPPPPLPVLKRSARAALRSASCTGRAK